MFLKAHAKKGEQVVLIHVLLKPLVTRSHKMFGRALSREYVQSNMLKPLAAFSGIQVVDACR